MPHVIELRFAVCSSGLFLTVMFWYDSFVKLSRGSRLQVRIWLG